MIRRMRLKFFFVTSAIVVLIIFIFCGAILTSTKLRDNHEAKSALEELVNSYENFEQPIGSEGNVIRWRLNARRVFLVVFENDTNPLGTVFISNYFEKDEIIEMASKFLEKGKLKNYLVEIKPLQNGEGKIVAGIDMTLENEAFTKLTFTVSLMGLGGTLLLMLKVWFLSYWIVRPAMLSLKKQARFISEASHELKTPLTIISAGVELIEKQNKNVEIKKWLDDIKIQTKKLTVMTADLLALSKIKEKEKIKYTEFNLSQIILNEALAFESVAYEQNKQFESDVQSNILYKGSINTVSQVVRILCDNAIKYSDEDGKINLNLKKTGSKIRLNVSNTNSSIKESELPFLFERFYRGSESRAQSSGTGLGLAILKEKCNQNNWKIDVKLDSNIITFIIEF